MITFIAHMHVPPDNAPAFEELMTYVADKSKEQGSGVVYYDFAKSVDDADTYVVVEVFRDQAACAMRVDTVWVRESVSKAMGLTEGVPNVVQYISPGTDPVVGRLEDMT